MQVSLVVRASKSEWQFGRLNPTSGNRATRIHTAARHVGEILEAILRALFETLFEVALKGPGYLLAGWFRPKSATNPDGCLVLIFGMAFWLLIGLSVWGVLVFL